MVTHRNGSPSPCVFAPTTHSPGDQVLEKEAPVYDDLDRPKVADMNMALNNQVAHPPEWSPPHPTPTLVFRCSFRQ